MDLWNLKHLMAPRRPSAKNSSEIPANTAKYSVKRVAHLLNVNGASTEATPSPGHLSCRPDRRPDGCQPDTRWQWWPNTHSFYPCNSFFPPYFTHQPFMRVIEDVTFVWTVYIFDAWIDSRPRCGSDNPFISGPNLTWRVIVARRHPWSPGDKAFV